MRCRNASEAVSSFKCERLGYFQRLLPFGGLWIAGLAPRHLITERLRRDFVFVAAGLKASEPLRRLSVQRLHLRGSVALAIVGAEKAVRATVRVVGHFLSPPLIREAPVGPLLVAFRNTVNNKV